MPADQWTIPVALPFEHVDIHEVTGPDEAVTCLTGRWPNRRGPGYVKALTACRGAIAGRVELERARAEFVAAINEVEAGLF